MEWLNPRAFWLLPLIALLFFFARRRRLESRWVGNLYLWAKSAPPDPSLLAVRRLRRHWLIALQAGFMLAVITALAHPVISSHAHRAAFVVDVSASMGSRDGTTTRLALARDRALAAAVSLPSGSRVRVMAAGPAPIDRGESAATGADLAATLGGLMPTAGSAALGDAINAVRARDGADADIYVFTDEPPPAAIAAGAAHWTQVGHRADNLAIIALAAARLPSNPAGIQVLVTVRNFGSIARTSGLELFRDTTVVARESMTVAPGASQSVTMTIRDTQHPVQDPMGRRGARPAVAAGFENPALHETLHVRLSADDALAVDNERWALVPSNTPLRVRLLTHGGAFVERALAANSSLSLEVSRPADLDAAAEAAGLDVDVLVCDGCRALPARGPALLIVPAPPPPPASPSAPASPGAPAAPADSPRTLDGLSLAGATHGVTQGIDLSGLAAHALPRVAGAVDGQVVARAADAPALVVSDRNGRRVVELNLDLASSTLPLSVSFPLVLANAIDWLGARSDQTHPAGSGDPLVWPRANPPAQATATRPDGRPVLVRAAGDTLVVTDTLVAGRYTMNAGSATRTFVVNPATESESDLSMTRETGPPGAPLSVSGHVAAASTSVAWPSALLIMALLLLAIEWRHFCRGAR